jgi:hypothetical protein
MPKAKPTQVIVHRIELANTERKMLEPIIAAKEVEQVAKSAAMIGGAAALGVGAYVAWWATESIFGWMGSAKDKYNEMKQTVKEYDEETDGATSERLKNSSPAARVFLTIMGV